MARGKVAQGTRAPKGRAERTGIESGPEMDVRQVTLEMHELERIDLLLERAAQSALNAAPQEIPTLFGLTGAEAAIAAHRDIGTVRALLNEAMGGAA